AGVGAGGRGLRVGGRAGGGRRAGQGSGWTGWDSSGLQGMGGSDGGGRGCCGGAGADGGRGRVSGRRRTGGAVGQEAGASARLGRQRCSAGSIAARTSMTWAGESST